MLISSKHKIQGPQQFQVLQQYFILNLQFITVQCTQFNSSRNNPENLLGVTADAHWFHSKDDPHLLFNVHRIKLLVQDFMGAAGAKLHRCSLDAVCATATWVVP